jgi:hypothetical protein
MRVSMTRQRQDNWIKRLKRQKDEKQFLSVIMNIICIKRTRSRTRRDSFAPIGPILCFVFAQTMTLTRRWSCFSFARKRCAQKTTTSKTPTRIVGGVVGGRFRKQHFQRVQKERENDEERRAH